LQKCDAVAGTVTLEDGSADAHAGKLELTEVAVDESTGTVTLRALFPNPEHTLLPGMYVRAKVTNGVKTDAILAPQQGITRDAKGNATALVVNQQNTVESREVETLQVMGDKWLIGSGLNNGDRVIVEGTGKVQAGMKVNAVDVTAEKTATSGEGH